MSRKVSSVRHQLRPVLLVVGDQRRDRVRVEALQLGRVVAHRRQQQPVGAGGVEGQKPLFGPAVRRCDVGGQQRLGGGAVQVHRVERDAAVADARPRTRAASRRASAARPRPRGGTVSSSAPGTSTAMWFAAQRRERARHDTARRTRCHRQRARLPVALGGRTRGCGATASTLPPSSRSTPELLAARDQVAPVADLALEHRLQEAAHRCLAGALRRPRALHLQRQQRRDHPQQRRLRQVGRGTEAQLPDDRLRHAQVDRGHAVLAPTAGRSPRWALPRRPPAPRPGRRSGRRSRRARPPRGARSRAAPRRTRPPRRGASSATARSADPVFAGVLGRRTQAIECAAGESRSQQDCILQLEELQDLVPVVDDQESQQMPPPANAASTNRLRKAAHNRSHVRP